MGYYINKVETEGIYFGLDQAGGYCDETAKAVVRRYESYYDDNRKAEIGAKAKAILEEKDVTNKIVALRALLSEAGFALVPDDGFGNGDRLFFEFLWENGEKWDEDDFLAVFKPIAKRVRRGAYVGFIGEDEDMWSYVCDGHGGYTVETPTVLWRGRAFAGNRTFGEIREDLEASGLLDGSDASMAMVACAVHNALEAFPEAKAVAGEDAFCSAVLNLWTDSEDMTDLGKIADVAVNYAIDAGELPDGNWADVRTWAESKGLMWAYIHI